MVLPSGQKVPITLEERPRAITATTTVAADTDIRVSRPSKTRRPQLSTRTSPQWRTQTHVSTSRKLKGPFRRFSRPTRSRRFPTCPAWMPNSILVQVLRRLCLPLCAGHQLISPETRGLLRQSSLRGQGSPFRRHPGSLVLTGGRISAETGLVGSKEVLLAWSEKKRTAPVAWRPRGCTQGIYEDCPNLGERHSTNRSCHAMSYRGKCG